MTGFCESLRGARPDLLGDCSAGYVNLACSTILFACFLHILNKLVRNNRRALAGYHRNTVSLDIHVRMLEGLILWCVMWGLYSFLDLDDASYPTSASAIAVDAIIYSASAFYESLLLFLLCSSSIGMNASRKAYVSASFVSLLLLSLFAYYSTLPSPPSTASLSSLVAARYLAASVLYLSGVLYSRVTAPSRLAASHYVAFVVPTSLCKAAGRLLMARDVDAGYCAYDIGRVAMFAAYPSVVYFVLKRDSQYWTADVTAREEAGDDGGTGGGGGGGGGGSGAFGFGGGGGAQDDDDDEEIHRRGYIDALTKSELPKYADVLIPRGELHFRRKLEESLGASLQLHTWRRKVRVVKVFQMDVLTKDGILNFKAEANAMMRLKHENIVRLHGVVIDPPSMGIVMEYCPNGDLFTHLEKLRNKRKEAGAANAPSKSSFGTPAGVPPLPALPPSPAPASRDLRSNSSAPPPPLFSSSSGSGSYLPAPSGEEHRPSGSFLPPVPSAATREESASSFGDYFKVPGAGSAAQQQAQREKESSFSPVRTIKGVARGMRYLHSDQGGRHAHRDLKSLNILLTDKFDCRIADFGECLNVKDAAGTKAHGNIGTPAWTAPEVLNHDRVSLKSDVFSFGVVLWELLTFLPPMIYLPKSELQRELKKGEAMRDKQLKRIIGSVLGVGPEDEQKRLYGGGGFAAGNFNYNSSERSKSGNNNSVNLLKAGRPNPLRNSRPGSDSGVPDSLRSRGQWNWESSDARSVSSQHLYSTTAESSCSELRESLLSNVGAQHDVRYAAFGSKTDVDASMDAGMSFGSSRPDPAFPPSRGGMTKSSSSLDIRGLASEEPSLLGGTKSKQDKRSAREAEVVIPYILNQEAQVKEFVAKRLYRPPLVLTGRSGAPQALVDLMQRCLAQDPNLRPDFKDIVIELDEIMKETPLLDEQFPFQTLLLVNYAYDHISSPLPPKPYNNSDAENASLYPKHPQPALLVPNPSAGRLSFSGGFNSFMTPRSSEAASCSSTVSSPVAAAMTNKWGGLPTNAAAAATKAAATSATTATTTTTTTSSALSSSVNFASSLDDEENK